ncbi:PHB depolymerase family esterase [Spirillospora sp. NPDC047279]|uniref:alpha/beta hydrolase family esterase n=1 Tax=Spirillospora sp. NPDC047279 TaxID=3155478 RepID=UPI0033CCE0E9
MRRPFLVPLALACALLTGCSGTTGSSASARSPSPAPSPARSESPRLAGTVPSSGCEGHKAASAATGQHSFGGRSYLLTLPGNHGGRTPVPLVVDLHGLRSTGFQQAVYGRMATVGSARGFAVVEPESAGDRTGWKLPGMTGGAADIAYVGALLDHLERTLCLDRRREFATGFSNGAGLSAALVCGLRGRLAAVAPVAGLNLARPCATARPTTIITFHGTADRVLPYRGGAPFGGDRRQIPGWMMPTNGVFVLPAVPTLAEGWARTFACAKTRRDVPARGIVRVSRTGCKAGVRVELYTVRSGGHTWPGGLPLGLGRTTDQMDATKLILDAFSRT